MILFFGDQPRGRARDEESGTRGRRQTERDILNP
jgi:hypothetical protein